MQKHLEAEKHLIHAIQLLSAHFPHSLEYANSLINLGVLYKNMQRHLEAKEQHCKAIQLFSMYYPHSN